MKLLVITKVPNPDTDGPLAQGNLAAPLAELWVLETRQGPLTRLEKFMGLPAGFSTVLRKEVFAVGDLLLVDDDGREIVGRGRKPSKWGIEYKTFEKWEGEHAIELIQALAAPATLDPDDDVHDIVKDIHGEAHP